VRNSVHEAAYAVLQTADPHTKCLGAFSLWAVWQLGQLSPDPLHPLPPPLLYPGLPERPVLLPPALVSKRKVGSRLGHAALLHAVAHIEFNAIQKPPIATWTSAWTRLFPIRRSIGSYGPLQGFRSLRSRRSWRYEPTGEGINASRRYSRPPPPFRCRSGRWRSCASSPQDRWPAAVRGTL